MLDELYMRDLAKGMMMPEEVVPTGKVTVSGPQVETAPKPEVAPRQPEMGTITGIPQTAFEKVLETSGIKLSELGDMIDQSVPGTLNTLLGREVPIIGNLKLRDFLPFVGSVDDGKLTGTPAALIAAGTGQPLRGQPVVGSAIGPDGQRYYGTSGSPSMLSEDVGTAVVDVATLGLGRPLAAGAKKAIQATKDLPIGMSIKDVSESMKAANAWANPKEFIAQIEGAGQKQNMTIIDRNMRQYAEQGMPLSKIKKELERDIGLKLSPDQIDYVGGFVKAQKGGSSPKLSAVKPGDELIVQHNLTAEKLISADKLGGMPVPSLAISKAATPLQNFGEITLIGSKEMATPSAKNPIFQTDAYTKRKPGITYSIDNKSTKNLDALFSDIKDKVPNYNSERYSLVDNIEDMSRNRLMQAKYLSEKGMLPDLKEFERPSQFEGEVRSIVDANRADYENWVNEFKDGLPDAGVVIKEKLFKGFTYAGNRIYREANLQNIVSAMKGGAGSEGINYGVGNLRAVATPKFKTFNQVKSSRSKIIGESAMSDVKNQADSAYQNLLGRLYDINSKYDASDAILEVAETKSMSNLDKIYGDKLPQELKADIGIFINKLKDLPAAYFEIKPQRSVDISEFKGAIIPKDTPKKARDVLEKNGITEIYEYSTPDERKNLFQKYGKEMFSVAPVIPAAATQEENK